MRGVETENQEILNFLLRRETQLEVCTRDLFVYFLWLPAEGAEVLKRWVSELHQSDVMVLLIDWITDGPLLNANIRTEHAQHVHSCSSMRCS